MMSSYLVTSAALPSSPLTFGFGDFVSSVYSTRGHSPTTTRSHDVGLAEKIFSAWMLCSKIRDRKNNWKMIT